MKILVKTIFFLLLINNLNAKENIMILKLKDGDVKIELFKDVAPKHVERIKKLASEGKYNDVVFHTSRGHLTICTCLTSIMHSVNIIVRRVIVGVFCCASFKFPEFTKE